MRRMQSKLRRSTAEGYRRHLILIEALVFGIPFLALLYFFLQNHTDIDLAGYKILYPIGILLAVLSGLLMLRQVVERFFGFYEQVAEYATDAAGAAAHGRAGVDLEHAAAVVTRAIERLEETNQELSAKVSGLSLMKELLSAGETLDVEKLLRSLLEKAMILAGAEIGSVFVSEPDGRLKLVHYKGPGEPPPDRFPCEEDSPIMTRVLEEAKPLLVTDIETDPRVAKKNDPKYKSPSFISLPLFAGDEPAGVLNLARKGNRAVFDQDDERLLSAVAKEMSFALKNAFLDRRCRLQKEQLDLLAGQVNALKIRQSRLEEEKKQLTGQMIHAQKMQAMGAMAGGLAHDFNNVLMAIQGNVSLLLLDVAEDHEHHSRLKSIEKQVASGSRLTRRLLGYARKEPQQWREVDINPLVRETAETFGRTRKDLELKLDLAGELPPVYGAPDQVEQILWNLYINASDAMPGGGSITITTRMVDQPGPNDREGLLPVPHVMLSVADTGKGIDPETITRIFEPFFTTKEAGKGTGLGLASVYGIVKAHGGRIDVESQGGEGATFKVYLPVCESAGDQSLPEGPGVVRGTGTILLVDDEKCVREVCEAMLTRLGYMVHAAASGEEALEIFERHGRRVDLVILDLIMPGLGGARTFERLRRLKPGVPILVATGLEEPSVLDVQMEAAAFIQKPFSVSQLSEALERFRPAN
ncbi:MAG: response regulator [Deltaproteobacteria bacterium]|nr:response regulator [Deltaproteobacteria bacterium]